MKSKEIYKYISKRCKIGLKQNHGTIKAYLYGLHKSFDGEQIHVQLICHKPEVSINVKDIKSITYISNKYLG